MSLLQPAINVGLSEFDFWNMSVIEVQRYLDGAVWRLKSQAQFDYSLANLIGVSVGRLLSSEVEFPTIFDVYPELFTEEERIESENRKQEMIMENSKAQFLAFVEKINSKQLEEGVENN